jgi:hypothetical protein
MVKHDTQRDLKRRLLLYALSRAKNRAGEAFEKSQGAGAPLRSQGPTFLQIKTVILKASF